MSQIRVKDYTGKVIHKKKRGFATKKEALEWERDFLNKATADMGMLFQDFVELYFEDMSHRLKSLPSSVNIIWWTKRFFRYSERFLSTRLRRKISANGRTA